jgi:hypothetical protein
MSRVSRAASFGNRDGAAQVFVGGQAQEGFRAEHHVVAVAGDEDPAQLGGVHAVGQAGGEERARAHAHVAVQSGQVQALAGLVQGAQCAKFVHRPDRAATGDGQADARGMAAAGVVCWAACSDSIRFTRVGRGRV